LSVLFTGDSPASTTIAYRRGIGGAFSNASAPVVLAGTGTIALAMTSLQRTIDSLTARETDIQTRLDRQRESLTARFTAMETALSALQAQGQWLTGQINSLSGLNSSK
jgi:flagellar hook-associated protein 2